jgi:hypothetical protein
MMRISERISEALSGVRCPGCGKFVKPTLPTGSAEDTAQDGGRWSFVWRAPSGEVCPECGFPLARYARRYKWIQTFSAGVVLLTVSFLLYVLAKMTELPGWYSWALRAMAAAGLLTFFIGLVGLVVGGRSGPGSSGPSGAS